MRPPGFPLLALPHPALVNIFSALAELADSVALSSCNKELWALGAAARRRYLCCAACGARAVEPSAAFNTDTFRHAPPLALADGASYAVDKEHVEAGCTLGEDLPLLSYTTLNSLREDAGIRIPGRLTVGPAALAWVQHIRCRGCGLHLGLRLTRLGRLRADKDLDAHTGMSHWRELRVLGVCFMGARYLHLRAADGREEHLGRPPLPAACAPYTCTAARSSLRKPGECGALLFDQRDILSREHCWDAGGGPERAFFINGFAPGAVAVCYEREELLCQVQGAMRVADVHCATCGARIGWKFCEDLTFREGNCNQVGRYGVVKSSIRKAKVS